jgi:hypothetical protein
MWCIFSYLPLEEGSAVKVKKRSGACSVETVGKEARPHEPGKGYLYEVAERPAVEGEGSWARLATGSWGVRMVGGSPSAGDRVTVVKRNGSVQTVTLGNCHGSLDDGSTLWSTERKATSVSPSRRAAHHQNGDGYGRCEECGRRGRLEVVADSSGIGGQVCGRCASIPSEMLSFA